ncbi:MAG TPA: hypothetical protein VMP01_01295 [Pirellulaceae bacterium]|nr:hypothetical protein [Pirellulaceae bacterium]
MAALLAVVYIGPFAQVGSPARQGEMIVRVLGIVFLMLAGGCSAWPFAGASSDQVPAEAVRSYAQAHGLTRDEARRELLMFRDAEQLRELRQSQGKPKDNAVQATFMTP